MSVLLEVRDVRVGYAQRAILEDVSLHANQHALVCVVGPSGCGKTTLLRAIAGFESVLSGSIVLNGSQVSAPGHTLSPERRGVGMVFQENTLFPHLTVAGNVAFGLRDHSSTYRRDRVRDLLDVVGLRGLQDRYPHELSGGQQQRVALARALAPEPVLVLLDEPFSSLDGELRERLGREVREILAERGITAMLVTHDQQEAFSLADRVAVMNGGRVLQFDTPYNLYHEPADRFVALFVGQGVFLRGTMLTPHSVETELGVLRGNRAYPFVAGSDVDVLIRPDDIISDESSPVQATVVSRAFKGAQILYSLRLPTGSTVYSSFPSHLDRQLGETVGVGVDADHLVVFSARD